MAFLLTTPTIFLWLVSVSFHKTFFSFSMLISHYLSKDLLHQSKLSSPRAESARAVTGRWWPHSGVGKDFLAGHWFFFKKMAATREKFKNLRCEIDCLAKGYKRAIDELRGPLAKMDSWSKIRIYGPKKRALLAGHHVLATTGQSWAKKKYRFPK